MRTFNTLSVPLEVKCWHQSRSCRQSSLTVAYPYCYRVFDMTGGGLGTLHARHCPRTYPFRLRHVGRDAVREKRRRRYDNTPLTLDIFLRLKSIVHSSGTRFVWSVLLYTVRDRNNSNSLDQSESEPNSVLKMRIPLLSTIFTLSAFYCAELFLPVLFRSIVFVLGKTSSFFSGFVHDLNL